MIFALGALSVASLAGVGPDTERPSSDSGQALGSDCATDSGRFLRLEPDDRPVVVYEFDLSAVSAFEVEIAQVRNSTSYTEGEGPIMASVASVQDGAVDVLGWVHMYLGDGEVVSTYLEDGEIAVGDSPFATAGGSIARVAGTLPAGPSYLVIVATGAPGHVRLSLPAGTCGFGPFIEDWFDLFTVSDLVSLGAAAQHPIDSLSAFHGAGDVEAEQQEIWLWFPETYQSQVGRLDTGLTCQVAAATCERGTLFSAAQTLVFHADAEISTRSYDPVVGLLFPAPSGSEEARDA